MNKLKIIKELWKGPKTYWELVAKVDECGLDFIKTMNEMNGKEIIEKKGKFYLKSRKEYAELFKNNFNKEIKIFNKITKQRPKPTSDFYQDFLGTEDIFKRIKLMHDLCDVQKKKIAVLGDDDLFGIALGLTGISKKIRCLEIDERMVSVINKNAKEYKINVKASEYNIANPVPQKHKGNYDVVITEPVETIEGLSIWLSRCAELLKKGGVLYFGLTLLESPFSKWREIEKMILKMGFAITDIKRNFSFYPPDQCQNDSDSRIVKDFNSKVSAKPVKWYRSWLIRCEAVKNPKPLIKGKKKLSKLFYYDKYFLG